jgi:hypothetical protein
MQDVASPGFFQPKNKVEQLQAELARIEKQIRTVTDYGFDVGPVPVEELFRRKKEIKNELAELEQASKLILIASL